MQQMETHGKPECSQVNYNNLIAITVSNNRDLYLKVSHINACSIYHKIQPFQEHILAKDVSLFAISKAWLPSDNEDLQYKEIPHQDIVSSLNHITMEDVGVDLH